MKDALNGSIASPDETWIFKDSRTVWGGTESIPTGRPVVRIRLLHVTLACPAVGWKRPGVRGSQSELFLRLLQPGSNGLRVPPRV